MDEVCRLKGDYMYRRNESTKPLETYASQPIVDPMFYVINGKVEAFLFEMSPRNYELIKNAAESFYGTGKETVRQLQNPYGAVYSSRIWTTRPTSGGIISVLEHTAELEYGGVTGQTEVYLHHTSRARKGDPAAAAKDM